MLHPSEERRTNLRFCEYVYYLGLFLVPQSAEWFGVQEMDDVYECARNALLWCFCHLTADQKIVMEWPIVTAMDILTTLRFTERLTVPDHRIHSGLPDALPGTRLPLSHCTKKEFYVATLMVNYLDNFPQAYQEFTWSCLKNYLWDDFNQAVQRSEINNELRISEFNPSLYPGPSKLAPVTELEES